MPALGGPPINALVWVNVLSWPCDTLHLMISGSLSKPLNNVAQHNTFLFLTLISFNAFSFSAYHIPTCSRPRWCYLLNHWTPLKHLFATLATQREDFLSRDSPCETVTVLNVFKVEKWLWFCLAYAKRKEKKLCGHI